jgi:hypothetical protein
MTAEALTPDYNSNVEVFREREYPMLKGRHVFILQGLFILFT